jgi:hypothetical protein
VLRSGYFYKHEAAPDIFIDVKKVYWIKPDEVLVKCAVFGYWLNNYYETTKFRLNRENADKWQIFNPRY